MHVTVTARIITKVAEGINTLTERGFEEKLDSILYEAKGAKNSQKDQKAKLIVKTVAIELGIAADEVRIGLGENGRFGINLCYYFIKDCLKWNNRQIAVFFKKKGEYSVRYGLKMINELKPGSPVDKDKLEILNRLKPIIENLKK